jgi:hypothetical protein
MLHNLQLISIGGAVNDDLLSARSQWYAAYLAGDVQRLEEVESATFMVVSGNSFQDRSAQLTGIAASVSEGRWFPDGSFMQDSRLDVVALRPDVMMIFGTSQITTPRGDHPLVAFTEVWTRGAADWQVAHLHCHQPPTATT